MKKDYIIQKINILTRLKQWILSVIRPYYSPKQSEKSNKIKSLFITYFDGTYGIDPAKGTSDTYSMGVCKLKYSDINNTLTVYLRRPGLLIGRQGVIINDLEKWLKCKIKIIEVNLRK